MANILFITTNSIRAAIGVTPAELKDDAIEDFLVEDNLQLYLARNYPDWSALADANKSGQTPTTEQVASFRALKLLCMYAAAVICLQGGPNWLAQEIQSGGVTTARFSKDDLETTLGRMESQRDYFLGVLTGDDPFVEFFVNPVISSHPNYDPVSDDPWICPVPP